MHQSREGSIVISRREFIRSIFIETTEQSFNIPINPGIQNSFPWLYKVARNFQEFQFLGFAAEYVPLSGWAISGTSAALGQIAFCYQYNVVAAEGGTTWPQNNFQGILNMEGAVVGAPATPMACYMECDPELMNQHTRFVFDGSPEPTWQNYSTQNFRPAVLIGRTGNAQNATQALAGMIFFTYEVAFHLPRPQDPAIPLSKGVYYEAMREFIALVVFTGQLTDEQWITLTERKRLLEAIFDSQDYKEHVALEFARASRDALRNKGKVPDIEPAVLKLLTAESKEDEGHLVEVDADSRRLLRRL